ncbi:MAG: orotate phosphoribosyltransferase [Oscillospiraceae bacterium]|jgi:orotate phosphoribosyltransferase|nr:orotate phosphoribosyltransferase [Oscillospiraceae bacterium]
METKTKFIEFMKAAGVLTLGDFTTKSGRKTPYFINTGNYRTGEQLAKLGEYYARTIAASGEKFDILFGPAYKGIPLVAVTAAALWSGHGINVSYAFNRKEAKDHGEGGVIVGATPKAGDRIAIIEDVTTAGTSVRETLAIMQNFEDVKVTALFVSVDRCERGTGEKSALREIAEEYGIRVYPIVTSREIAATLPAGGAERAAMEAYLAEYGAE